jgi:hypothetical protein
LCRPLQSFDQESKQEIAVAELSEEERKVILGDRYKAPDPNAPKPEVRPTHFGRLLSLFRRQR